MHNIVGEENKGFYMAMEGFNAARVLVCAACTGGAERALEISAEYTKNRNLFGQPLAKFEGISSSGAGLLAILANDQSGFPPTNLPFPHDLSLNRRHLLDALDGRRGLPFAGAWAFTGG
jgi:hypothetical protein